jgi:hypothetical protein
MTNNKCSVYFYQRDFDYSYRTTPSCICLIQALTSELSLLSAATCYSALHLSRIHLFHSVLSYSPVTMPLSLLPLSLPSFLPFPSLPPLIPYFSLSHRPGKKTSKRMHLRPARTSSTTARGRRRHSTTHYALEELRLSRHQWYVR